MSLNGRLRLAAMDYTTRSVRPTRTTPKPRATQSSAKKTYPVMLVAAAALRGLPLAFAAVRYNGAARSRRAVERSSGEGPESSVMADLQFPSHLGPYSIAVRTQLGANLRGPTRE
eukprot:8808458-Pyramimonas_sp.AAC.1